MLEAPAWIGELLQFATLITSILAIVTFVKNGQKVKVEQAQSQITMMNSISTIADSQKRTDEKVTGALRNAELEHDRLWGAVDKITEKQTTLCALHGVNHPGQSL